MFSLTEIVSVIGAIGVLGTLIIGIVNLFFLKTNQKQSNEYNLRLLDFEKRRDILVSTVSEYIALLDVHSLSYCALTDEEYEGKDLEIGTHYYKLETAFYKIKLNLNTVNPSYSMFLSALEKSLKTAENIKTNTTLSEMLANGLRNPEQYAKAYIQATQNNNLDKASVISEAKN